jgi:hypothetical protein
MTEQNLFEKGLEVRKGQLPDPLDTLAVHDPTHIPQQSGDPAIAVADGKRDDLGSQPMQRNRQCGMNLFY